MISIVVLGVLVLFVAVMLLGSPIRPLGGLVRGVLYSVGVYVPLIALTLVVLNKLRKREL